MNNNATTAFLPLETVTIDNFFEQATRWNLEPLRRVDRDAWSGVWEFCNLMNSARLKLDHWRKVASFVADVNESLRLVNAYIQQGLITPIEPVRAVFI